VTLADEVGHALREHGCLPRTGAGDHQHRTMHVSNGLLLPFIGRIFVAGKTVEAT